MEERKIIHVDMDAFFAAVEQRDKPELRGIPLAVGFDGDRGVVSTASYEARRFGVHSAQSIQVAKRLCPQLTIVLPDFHRYKAVSEQVRSIFLDYTDQIEPISIDEAFLDVTHNKKGIPLAVDIAEDIRRRIREELHLTASAGVSYNKFLAKIASDYRKPDGLCVIHPDKAVEFISQLRVEKFWGVGPKTAARMHSMGIFTGEQLRRVSKQHLVTVFGKVGTVYYDFARGIDPRPVETDYVRKSVGCEQTFMQDISLRSAVVVELYHTVLELEGRLKRAEFRGKTLTLKVKYADFAQITRSLTADKNLKTKADILPLAKKLLAEVDYSASHPIRLIGLSVSNPHTEDDLVRHPEWIEGCLPFED
ncbi:DNA polymerase IV [Prevotella sp. KH2C16]|uniref:DNA polymerase IV n=1 Tax=Prevotella sp. KH2C16 TaxID=1855325 RepID=UPI0015A5795D